MYRMEHYTEDTKVVVDTDIKLQNEAIARILVDLTYDIKCWTLPKAGLMTIKWGPRHQMW